MQQLQSGQPGAMSVLFSRYQGPMYRYFMKQSLDGALSQELTQQLFVRVFEKNQSFSGKEGMFKPWIYRIATNLWMDHVRVAAPRKKPIVELNPDHEEQALADDGFKEDDFRKLDAALQLLSAEHRQILILSKYQGLKYQDIAKALDISENAVKIKVFRALKALRAIYFDKTIKEMML